MRCLCCRESFVADRRNQHHQKFCSKPACRQASKRSSQRAWLTQPQNQDYFRGPAHSERVRAWRQNHPRYWQKRRKKPVGALQDVCPAQVAEPQPLEPPDSQDLFRRTLQDVCRVQTPLLVGLISQMIDSPLQEDIVGFVRRVVAKGQDLLDMPSRSSLNTKTYDSKETPSSGSLPASARSLQLDRSSAHSSASAP